MKLLATGHRPLTRVFSLKKESAFLFILAALLAAPLSLLHALATGGQPDEFMSYGAGARSLAMGAAFVGVADDASAGYWNPAGLSQITRKELTLLQATLFADTTYDYYSYVQPSKKGGSAWGVSMTKMANSGFEKVNATIDPTTPDLLQRRQRGQLCRDGVGHELGVWPQSRGSRLDRNRAEQNYPQRGYLGGLGHVGRLGNDDRHERRGAPPGHHDQKCVFQIVRRYRRLHAAHVPDWNVRPIFQKAAAPGL